MSLLSQAHERSVALGHFPSLQAATQFALMPLQDFSVYKAGTPEKLAEAVANKQSAWCGLGSLLAWDATHCVTHVSPFRDTAVAVVRRGSKLSKGQFLAFLA